MELLLIARVVIVALFVGAAVAPDESEAATSGSISYLHGDGYASGDSTRNVTRLDVTTVGRYGMAYGRFDNSSFDDANSAVSSRIIGHLGTGLHLSAQTQNTGKVSNTAVGAGFSVFAKGYKWGVDVGKLSSNVYGEGIHYFGFATFPIYGEWFFDGWMEYFQRERGTDVLFMQPSVMYRYGSLSTGVEYQFVENKGGVKGLTEAVPQFKVKWEF